MWPALQDEIETLSLVYFDDKNDALVSHLGGQIRLATLHWARELRDMKRQMLLNGPVRINATYLGGATAVEDAIWERVMKDVFGKYPIRQETEWNKIVAEGGKLIHSTAEEYTRLTSEIIIKYEEIRKTLISLAAKSHRQSFVEDRLTDAEALVSADFISSHPPEQWKVIPRWLDGIVSRARKGAADPAKDRRSLEVWQPIYDRLEGMKANLSSLASREKREALEEASLMIQELSISLFAAGEVRAIGKISESRMTKKLDEIILML